MSERSKKYAICIGRWQPPHKGHEWLVQKCLDERHPVLIMVRDIEPDENNPLTAEQVQELLDIRWWNDDVTVWVIPDIVSVNYGRGVGYGICEHEPPEDIEGISATDIRDRINNGDDSWREFVDDSIQEVLVGMLDGGFHQTVEVPRRLKGAYSSTWLEQRTHNPQISGSSPDGPTKTPWRLEMHIQECWRTESVGCCA